MTSKTPPNDHFNLIGIDIIILWPENSTPIAEANEVNKYSVILKIIINEKHILLLPGDAKGECWTKIDAKNLNADIFKYPHHGGNIGNQITAKELIEKVNPKKVVVSYGKKNSHGHPSKDYKNAKEELANTIEFYDTTKGDVIFHYTSSSDLLTTSKNSK